MEVGVLTEILRSAGVLELVLMKVCGTLPVAEIYVKNDTYRSFWAATVSYDGLQEMLLVVYTLFFCKHVLIGEI